MERTNFDGFRFYYYPPTKEMNKKLDDKRLWTYTCDKCGWEGKEINAAVDEAETHMQYLCPQCGLVLGGIVESLEAFYKEKSRMEHVLDSLDRVAELLHEQLPIVFLPLIDGKDPLNGKPALVLRKMEYKAELDELYKVGRIDLGQEEKSSQLPSPKGEGL
jgi:predicted RNA-binding Zn-ribbon protein involved in translation (DUF1610 family)